MIDFKLNTKKNLLAFSAGVDSTALFFLLLERNIPFDIAIVNYNTREESKQEVAYAVKLALKYKKQCFIRSVELETSNFEFTARKVRYDFFEELIEEYEYETLLTAHQLNDKLEWFLMQLSKGSGLVELLGLNETLQKDTYTIYRPLINTSKKELEEFLKQNNHHYFYDESNSSLEYRRNYFRENFSNTFLQEFQSGIQKSFEYLQNDLNSLNVQNMPIYKQKELEVFKNSGDDNLNIRTIDINLKKRGYLLTKLQRDEILKQKECVIDSFAICITQTHIFIAPYIKEVSMSKDFKELCRVSKIPNKIRPYLFEEDLNIENISKL